MVGGRACVGRRLPSWHGYLCCPPRPRQQSGRRFAQPHGASSCLRCHAVCGHSRSQGVSRESSFSRVGSGCSSDTRKRRSAAHGQGLRMSMRTSMLHLRDASAGAALCPARSEARVRSRRELRIDARVLMQEHAHAPAMSRRNPHESTRARARMAPAECSQSVWSTSPASAAASRGNARHYASRRPSRRLTHRRRAASAGERAVPRRRAASAKPRCDGSSRLCRAGPAAAGPLRLID